MSRPSFITWTVLCLSLGYLIALFVADLETVSAPAPMTVLQHDIHRRAPFVDVREINNGHIVGSVGTGARLIFAGEPVVPLPDRSFRIPAAPFLVNIVDIPVPRSSRFVASKRGTKYYDIESSAWRALKSELLFFRSAKEAEALGYTASTR